MAETTKATTVAQEEEALKAQLAKLQRTKHSRELMEALDGGWLPQGTRLVDPANPEEGRVLVFTPEEGAAMVDALRKIVSRRNKEQG